MTQPLPSGFLSLCKPLKPSYLVHTFHHFDRSGVLSFRFGGRHNGGAIGGGDLVLRLMLHALARPLLSQLIHVGSAHLLVILCFRIALLIGSLFVVDFCGAGLASPVTIAGVTVLVADRSILTRHAVIVVGQDSPLVTVCHRVDVRAALRVFFVQF